MDNDAILTVQNLSKSFYKYQVLTDVSYELKRGQIAAIIGPNGAGKSTFFNLVTGYHGVSGGHVYFKGKEITNWSRHKIARIGIARAFQVSNIYPKLTTYENVRQSVLAQQKKTLNFFTPASKLAKGETLELLDVTGLSHQEGDVPVGSLEEFTEGLHGLVELLGELALFLIAPGLLQAEHAGVQAGHQAPQFGAEPGQVVSETP